MDLKIIEIEGRTYAEVQDGKPVYVSDGKEIAFDAPGTAQTITRLNAEAKSHRERAQAAETSLKAFEGIDSPEDAIKALKTMQGLDAKALIDAGKADEMRAAAIKAVEDKYKPMVERADTLEKQLRQEKIGGSFARSAFIAEKLAVPVPMVEATFGSHFTLEDGRMIAKDANGNTIYSRANPGEPASFDDAIEQLVGASPYKDSIMKGLQQSGSGAKPGSGGGAGAKTISRTEFMKLAPAAQQKAVTTDGMTVTD